MIAKEGEGKMPKLKNSHQLTPSGAQWLLFTIVLLWFFFTFIYTILHSFLSFEKPNGYLLQMSLQIFTILIPAALYLYPKNIDITETFLIHRLDRKNLFLLIGLGVCMQFLCRSLNALMVLLLEGLGANSPASSLAVPDSFASGVLAVFAVVLVPAVTEELLMRGVVLHAYLWRGNRAAIAASAFLFGLLHLDLRNFLSTALLGVLLAYVVLETGSVFAGIVLHGTNNLLVLLGYMIERNIPVLWMEIALTVLVVISLLAMPALLRSFRLHNRENPSRMDLPMKRSVPYELGRTVFSLPGLLMLASYVLVQIQLFGKG